MARKFVNGMLCDIQDEGEERRTVLAVKGGMHVRVSPEDAKGLSREERRRRLLDPQPEYDCPLPMPKN